jgi:uncharacterized cupredoxin-like copper-binding protein
VSSAKKIREAERRRHARLRNRLLAGGAVVVAGGAVAAVLLAGQAPARLDVPTSPRLELTAVDMAYRPSEVAVAAGEVTIVLRNDGAVDHDLDIVGVPGIVEAGPGDTATVTRQLAPGRYEFFCTLPGHREAGMRGVLEVR